jgi:hypothetical protein
MSVAYLLRVCLLIYAVLYLYTVLFVITVELAYNVMKWTEYFVSL